MLLDPQASAAAKGGVAVSVVLAAWVILVLARSAFAGALVVSRAPAKERNAARSLEVAHGAAAIATMIVEQLQLMHTLSFATSLPRAYTVFLVQFKWANFVVVTSPFARLASRCEFTPSTPTKAISMALELMELTPEAFLTSVVSCVACLLALTCALNLVVWLWLSSRHRPLPAMWSLPRMQAAVLFAAYGPVTLASVVILVSSGCSPIYTSVACIVLSCVPCAFIGWVVVAIRKVLGLSLLVSWRLANNDAERSNFVGVWRHEGQEGQRLMLRLGCIFLQQRRPMALLLPVDMLVKSASCAILICCTRIGLPITGALLLAIECARLVTLLLFRPYNSHVLNFWRRSSSLGQVAQILAVFFVSASNRQFLWPIALAVQIVLLLLLALSSLRVSHGELVAAQSYYYVAAPQPAQQPIKPPSPHHLVLPAEDRYRCGSVGGSGCAGALRRATVLVVGRLRSWMRWTSWTSWTSWPWHRQAPSKPGTVNGRLPPRSGCIDWGRLAVFLQDGLRFWWGIVCTVLELSDSPAMEIIPVVAQTPRPSESEPRVWWDNEPPPPARTIVEPGDVIIELEERPVPDTMGWEERQAITPVEPQTSPISTAVLATAAAPADAAAAPASAAPPPPPPAAAAAAAAASAAPPPPPADAAAAAASAPPPPADAAAAAGDSAPPPPADAAAAAGDSDSRVDQQEVQVVQVSRIATLIKVFSINQQQSRTPTVATNHRMDLPRG